MRSGPNQGPLFLFYPFNRGWGRNIWLFGAKIGKVCLINHLRGRLGLERVGFGKSRFKW